METTALNDIATTGITFQKNVNSISIQYKDGAFIIETEHWEVDNISEIEELFNIVEKFKKNVHPEVEEAIRKINEASVKAVKEPKAVRTGQFAKRWTDEQKKHIAKRYKSGERTSTIAKDYGVSANTIYQLMLRSGVQREVPAKNGRPPQKTEPADEKTEKERKKALKEYRESQDLPWYLKDSKSNKKD